MLTVATQVTTVVALIAFISALFVIAYKQKLAHDLEIVKSADTPEKIRTIRSIKGLLIDLDAGKLTGAQTLDLAKAQLAISASSSTKVVIALILLALILAITSVALKITESPSSGPSLTELKELLKDPAPEQQIQSVVARWGAPNRIIQPGPIYENGLWSGEVGDVGDDVYGTSSEDQLALAENQYSVSVYFVDEVADLYVVRIDESVVAIGLGVRSKIDLPMIGAVSVGFDSVPSTYSRVTEGDFRFEGCVGRFEFRDVDNYWGIGKLNYGELRQSDDQVHFYSCHFIQNFGKDKLFHFLFRERDICSNWETGINFYADSNKEFNCIDIDPRHATARPFASIVFFGRLKDQQDDVPTEQAVISYIIGTFAAPRYS